MDVGILMGDGMARDGREGGGRERRGDRDETSERGRGGRGERDEQRVDGEPWWRGVVIERRERK
jgi:hypothetical protein